MEKRVSKVEALPRLAPEFRVAAYARVSSEKDCLFSSMNERRINLKTISYVR